MLTILVRAIAVASNLPMRHDARPGSTLETGTR